MIKAEKNYKECERVYKECMEKINETPQTGGPSLTQSDARSLAMSQDVKRRDKDNIEKRSL